MLISDSYDPPRALSARDVAASPTMAHAPAATTATPRQTWVPVPVTALPPTGKATTTSAHTHAAESPAPEHSSATTAASHDTAKSAHDTEADSTTAPEHSSASTAASHDTAIFAHDTEADSTSTQTVQSTIWANVITTSIDYSSSPSQQTGTQSTLASDTEAPHDLDQSTDKGSTLGAEDTKTPTSPGAHGAPSPFLRPQPLVDQNGVSVESRTLTLGQALTLGDGPSKTTLSLEVQESRTLLRYGTSAVALVPPGAPSHADEFGGHTVYQLSSSVYVVESQTLKPGSAVTIGHGQSAVIYRIIASAGHTWLAAGTSTTGPMRESEAPTSSVDLGDLAFTRAPDGNFALDGTTLVSGKTVTVGSGKDKTTLAITSLQSVPAIVIDGSMTAQLSQAPKRANKSSSVGGSATLPPLFTSSNVRESSAAPATSGTRGSDVENSAKSMQVSLWMASTISASVFWWLNF